MYYIRISNEIVTLGFQSLNKPHGKKRQFYYVQFLVFFFFSRNQSDFVVQIKKFLKKTSFS